ncbi:hypothetical protein [Methylobacterium sp. WL1]|uniref:hypothetical protein n=1 Tax=Methylobacterium sp. WL1 TaxID=2603276 RepID=UPI001FEF17D7|nr:hypothetical protein [Methylobacterium sp. WL1]
MDQRHRALHWHMQPTGPRDPPHPLAQDREAGEHGRRPGGRRAYFVGDREHRRVGQPKGDVGVPGLTQALDRVGVRRHRPLAREESRQPMLGHSVEQSALIPE